MPATGLSGSDCRWFLSIQSQPQGAVQRNTLTWAKGNLCVLDHPRQDLVLPLLYALGQPLLLLGGRIGRPADSARLLDVRSEWRKDMEQEGNLDSGKAASRTYCNTS